MGMTRFPKDCPCAAAIAEALEARLPKLHQKGKEHKEWMGNTIEAQRILLDRLGADVFGEGPIVTNPYPMWFTKGPMGRTLFGTKLPDLEECEQKTACYNTWTGYPKFAAELVAESFNKMKEDESSEEESSEEESSDESEAVRCEACDSPDGPLVCKTYGCMDMWLCQSCIKEDEASEQVEESPEEEVLTDDEVIEVMEPPTVEAATVSVGVQTDPPMRAADLGHVVLCKIGTIAKEVTLKPTWTLLQVKRQMAGLHGLNAQQAGQMRLFHNDVELFNNRRKWRVLVFEHKMATDESACLRLVTFVIL